MMMQIRMQMQMVVVVGPAVKVCEEAVDDADMLIVVVLVDRLLQPSKHEQKSQIQ
jgi:hypothetical protein